MARLASLRSFFAATAVAALVTTRGAAATSPSTAALDGTLSAPGVVWVSDGSAPAPSAGTAITQRDKTFSPDFAVVTAGTVVRFRNEDTLDHSVYSVSPADPFDLGIYEPGPGKDVAFPNPGAIEIRCHVHRHMHAVLIVVDGPYERVERAGAAWSLRGVHAGRHVLHIWTAAGGETSKTVEVR
jgi:plastocyanin